ncbi:MAG: sporulation transcriptional regulator SpoIIID [Clostridia bacterium]|nr:sporulation transcriptional regulator SpoIIID [Clostridia bacterium]
MKEYIEKRATEFASYIIANKCTVRDTAKVFGISKSTVHKDIADRLPKINRRLFEAVRIVLDENKSKRHIRGGMATREKYLKLKQADM